MPKIRQSSRPIRKASRNGTRTSPRVSEQTRLGRSETGGDLSRDLLIVSCVNKNLASPTTSIYDNKIVLLQI